MADKGYHGPLEQVDKCMWRIPKSYKSGMRVDGHIFANKRMIEEIRQDSAPEQVANVAMLPGIQRASMAMPDIHWGYGFPIGGVCATDPSQDGVISPGGVGYDINCGVRLVRTDLERDDVTPQLEKLTHDLYRSIPAGVGQGGKYHFGSSDLRKIMSRGVQFLKSKGLAPKDDVERTEARGCMEEADPDAVTERAIARGADQCGTLGSGNHFVEIQVVDSIEDAEAAQAMGLHVGQVCVMIHSGSRGLGYQVCDDSLRQLRQAPKKYGIDIPDRQLVCAPVDSPEGRTYIAAMACAANFAWCNRQLLMCQVRDCFGRFFGRRWEELGMQLIYDVAHNIAKFEKHTADDGQQRTLCVHRKGATRAFPAGHPETPVCYREIGQPVLIPGDMGGASWVLTGQPGSMERTFGSACHGAGRVMSRTAAIRSAQGRHIDKELAEQGIIARARNRKSLAEEQPDAYKDVDEVVESVHRAGLAKKVARLRPMGVVKG